MSGPTSVRTNAKLNLFLGVLGPRHDGFHAIETIFHSVGLADELTFWPSSSSTVEIEVEPSDVGGESISVADNLIRRAAELLRARRPLERGARVSARKQIPVGAGLAGGSANAAGTLLVLNELWNLGFDRREMLEMAAELGSDVPFCLQGGTALARGRGERFVSVAAPRRLWFVLGLSDEPLMTRDVYERWDALGAAPPPSSAPMRRALALGDAEEIAALLHNDLEPAASSLRPRLNEKKRAVLEAGALGASLSGSGPTVFGLGRDEEHALAIASRLHGVFDRVAVAASRPTCVERLA